jgi:hypothetical protein
MEVSDQLHAPAAVPRREKATGTYWIGCVDHRAGLDAVEKKECLADAGN